MASLATRHAATAMIAGSAPLAAALAPGVVIWRYLVAGPVLAATAPWRDGSAPDAPARAAPTGPAARRATTTYQAPGATGRSGRVTLAAPPEPLKSGE